MMLRRWWRSTFGVVTLIALGFAVATTVIGVLAYEVTHEALEQQLDHRVDAETQALLAEAREDGLGGVAEAIRRRGAARSTASLDYLLVDRAGRRLAGTFDAAMPSEPGYVELLHYRRDGEAGIAQSVVTRLPRGMLLVGADRAGLDEIDLTLAALFAAALAAVLLLGTGAAALVGWLTRRRLARIETTAGGIIAGDLSRRVPRDGSGSEFDRLAATLNQMLERISMLMDSLRQVSSDVAHDLRTPLTRLHNQLERAADGDQEALPAARRQASELLELFAAVLRIAEVEGLAERRAAAAVDVSALLVEMAETYWPDVDAGGRRLEVDVADGLVVRGDRRLFAQAVSNLLENAIRHTPVGTLVSISAAGVESDVEITVRDDGPGVDPSGGDRLFQRFARSEASRTTPGHGLGLALVRAIAVSHGGDAVLTGQPGFGVSMRLPR